MRLQFLSSAAALFGLTTIAIAQEIAPAEAYSSQIPPAPNQTPPSAPDNGDKKGMFTRRDNRERVVNAPDKPVQLKKLKFGGDQSEPTGAFKGSILDKEIDIAESKRQSEAAKQKDQPSANAAESPAPKPKAAESPSATPSASPSPSAKASASAQDRQ